MMRTTDDRTTTSAIVAFYCVMQCFLVSGCSEDGPISERLKNITTDPPIGIECVTGWTCRFLYNAYVNDDDQYHYYWSALIGQNDTVVSKGVYAFGSSTNKVLVQLVANYFDFSPGTSAFDRTWRVYRCNSPSDVGAPNRATSTISISVPGVVFAGTCATICCSDSTFANDRWYAAALKRVVGVTGVEADILSWLDSKMCGYARASTEPAVTNVHINVSANPSMWAQVGIKKVRASGQTQAIDLAFFEVASGHDSLYYVQLFNAPANGTKPRFRCELDVPSGTWRFYYSSNLVLLDSHHAAIWVGTSGSSVSYTAEIFTRESDMMGTFGSPCVMSNCRFRTTSDWKSADFEASEYGSDDPDEWGIEVFPGGNEVRVWDRNPLP